MLTIRKIGAVLAMGLMGVLATTSLASALTSSDRPAAGVVLPRIDVDEANAVDTLVRITNAHATEEAIAAKCFYTNGNNHCTNTGQPCTSATDSACQDGTGAFGVCAPDWTVTDFQIFVTARQPLAWFASEGLAGSAVPIPTRGFCNGNPLVPCSSDKTCGGAAGSCELHQSNSGTLVPPTPETPFMGELRCIQIDPLTGNPFDGGTAADLTATASIITVQDDDAIAGTIDVGTYNGVGFTIATETNGDNQLDIAPDAELNACTSVVIVDHLFDGASNPIDEGSDPVREARTELTLVPCSVDLTGADRTLGVATAQFLVFNEFEQRFSSSRRVDCFFKSQLSLIDTSQPDRSIWSAGVSGTVSGQTRVRPVGSGLISSARLIMGEVELAEPEPIFVPTSTAAYNNHQEGDRTQGDTIILP
jgi:hypothetical protein